VEGPIAEVVPDVDGTEVTSTVTGGSVDRPGLAAGDEATAVITAGDVTLSN